MLSKSFRTSGSSFTRIPNPTMDYWVEGFIPTRLLEAFQHNVIKFQKKAPSDALATILNYCAAILKTVGNPLPQALLSLDVYEAAECALDHSQETRLSSRPGRSSSSY
jgi:hypothetical protein